MCVHVCARAHACMYLFTYLRISLLIYFVHVCGHLWATVCRRKSKDKLQELVLIFNHLGPRDGIQIIRVDNAFPSWAIFLAQLYFL